MFRTCAAIDYVMLAAPALNADEIGFRRRTHLAQAGRLASELAQLSQRAQAAQRWVQALPVCA